MVLPGAATGVSVGGVSGGVSGFGASGGVCSGSVTGLSGCGSSGAVSPLPESGSELVVITRAVMTGAVFLWKLFCIKKLCHSITT